MSEMEVWVEAWIAKVGRERWFRLLRAARGALAEAVWTEVSAIEELEAATKDIDVLLLIWGENSES